MLYVLSFPQGWSDIMNSLALIDFYRSKIQDDDELLVISQNKEKKKMIKYYIQQKDVSVIHYNVYDYLSNNKECMFINSFNNTPDTHLIVHGLFDILRKDQYNNAFKNSKNNNFYEVYDIHKNCVYEYFILNRDYKLEDEIYNKLVKNTKQYKVKIGDIDLDGIVIDLHNKSEIILDMIKVLENSYEMHLIDGVYAVMCYILQKKYKLFENISINIYMRKDYHIHDHIFLKDFNLTNWKIIKMYE